MIGDFNKWIQLLRSIGMSTAEGSTYQKLHTQLANDIMNKIPISGKYNAIKQFPINTGQSAIEKKMLLQSMQEDVGRSWNIPTTNPNVKVPMTDPRWNMYDLEENLPTSMPDSELTFPQQRAMELYQLLHGLKSKRYHDARN